MTALAPNILSNRPARAVEPPLVAAEGVELARGRAHEITGLARRWLALQAAMATSGPILWIAPAWCRVSPNPSGLPRGLDPGRITYVSPTRAEDVLWCVEEVLRSGAAPLAIADLPAPPGLTPVRRLHLAAETGAEMTGRAPVGLLLTPEGNAPGVETRWQATPACTPDRLAWRITRLRARTAPQATWTLDATGRKIATA